MAIFSRLPRLYPIIDAGLLIDAGISMEGFARGLRQAGIRFLQYRDKTGTESEVLERASMLRAIFPVSDSCLILNDRVSLALATRFDGVHVGQDDMPPDKVRSLVGSSAIVGVSTHHGSQVKNADGGPADYVAIGPVFTTLSKENPDPVIGLEGVRGARQLTGKSLVAIGGINRANALAVLDAGADSVAILSDLLPGPGEPIGRRVEEFLLVLEESAPFLD
jgi:thiamine-phosphate pyrophosphorylase